MELLLRLLSTAAVGAVDVWVGIIGSKGFHLAATGQLLDEVEA